MFKRLLLALIITGNLIFAQDVVINEVMASNQTAVLDEDGDASDYLELYNNGTEPIDLTGYYLSDNIEKIQKWQFGTAVIELGEYLIVFASDKDRQTTYWHTNFKISASGESIILSDTSGTIIDQVDLPESMVDISYARITDGSPDWVFQLPTPGSANTGTETLGTSDKVTVSYPGGFYSTAISVELTAGDCQIFYTLDGSDPDSNKTEYLSPINIDSTAVLKAISYKANYLPSPI
ncbi:MAG: lamin tail domain-containing protein, partial [Candidatus Marinimicrobia bacterium]|nr:lamin tail domain-containing protein [Candidatus Neomarinimicrobiota bacterium]